ncbi:MAG: type II/IV secretion system protein [Planctomycetes bacterium]|nr:type II/IV secretion system protein [Planctomycetota bacterium]
MALEAQGRIGDRLVDKGRISEDQLAVALAEQKRVHRPLGEILQSLGFCRQEDIAELVAEDLGLTFLREHDIQPDPLITSTLDREFVNRTGAFPVSLTEGTLRVAMVSPDDPASIAAVRERFPYPLELAMTSERTIAKLVSRYVDAEIGRVAGIFAELQAAGDVRTELPIEALTEALLVDGVNRGATDIHVEPEERVTRVRYRVDGVLAQGENLPAEATAAIISRLKIISNLDISERRRPQDGRLRLEINDRHVDMRVSVMPCTWGENVVLRILDRGRVGTRLGALGLGPDRALVLRRVVARPHGLFLVTGPTGSGKTTTLYAMLGMVDAMARNVATIEDPVEYRLPLLRQSQIDPSIGFTFHAGLRALLRQDPDVILIGEIRDAETADMAVKASMTGHLVLSTLHTNTALGAVARLADIGVEPYLVEDCLIGAMGQRLVRTICDNCAEAVAPNESELAWLGQEPPMMRRGGGCARCNETGLAGRTVIAELFMPSEEVAEVIRTGGNHAQLARLAAEAGYVPLEADGKRLVAHGITTMEEVLRVNASHRLTHEERALL